MPDDTISNNTKPDINRTDKNQHQIAQLMAVASNSLDLQSYIDRNYVYHYVNQTWLEYWQMQRTQVEGSTALDVWGERVFNEIVKPRIDTALTGELIEYQSLLHFPQRGKRHVDMAYIPARDESGQVIGVVVRVHDIDNLKKMGEALQGMVRQLEEKNQSQERLIHTLSHDLREPVNTLVNFSSLLLDEFGVTLSMEARRYAGFIHSGSERLRVLLNDLLSLVRLDQQCVELGRCDLNAIFDGVVNDLGSAIESAHARVTRGDLPMVTGQASLLQLLLQNLLANAIKFVSRDVSPRIHLEVYGHGDSWQFELADNGIGIAEPYREKVFDLFARLHSRNEYEGTGFGLAACRRIVELHGGRIWIEPVSGSTGSRFCFTLPIDSIINQFADSN